MDRGFFALNFWIGLVLGWLVLGHLVAMIRSKVA